MFPSYFAETKKDKLRLQWALGSPLLIMYVYIVRKDLNYEVLRKEASPPKFLPSECRWVVQDDCYRLKWYDGEASPTTVKIFVMTIQKIIYAVVG